MQDQHFMQSWNDGHSRFSADLDSALRGLKDRITRRASHRKAIRNPYGLPAEAMPEPSLPPAAKASLRGLAASVITVALWVVVLALATPAPGLAASNQSPVASAGCAALA